MMKPLHIQLVVLSLILIGILDSCVSGKAASKTTNTVGSFKDDVSAFRPVYVASNDVKTTDPVPVSETSKPTVKGKPVGDITQKLNVILDTIAGTNKNIRYAQGYRVQIYSGNSSEDANRARDKSYSLFPDITPHIVYIQPNFRVKVGDFIDKLEAQRVYVALKIDFPTALIVPERIEIR